MLSPMFQTAWEVFICRPSPQWRIWAFWLASWSPRLADYQMEEVEK